MLGINQQLACRLRRGLHAGPDKSIRQREMHLQLSEARRLKAQGDGAVAVLEGGREAAGGLENDRLLLDGAAEHGSLARELAEGVFGGNRGSRAGDGADATNGGAVRARGRGS